MKKISIIVLLICSILDLKSQEVISTSGDFLEKNNKTIQFTIGEVAIETLVGDDLTVTQGFNQPSYTITSLNKNPKIDIHVNVYPNPVTELLSVETTKKGCNWKLFDSNGKQLDNGKITEEIKIEFQQYKQGAYILSVLNADQLIETFRIIKE